MLKSSDHPSGAQSIAQDDGRRIQGEQHDEEHEEAGERPFMAVFD